MKVINVLSQYLESLGMSKDQSTQVLINTKNELGNYIKLNAESSDYSNMIISLWKQSVKRIGLEWIISNEPQAWFKPMFQ
jgi:hypothetical protein